MMRFAKDWWPRRSSAAGEDPSGPARVAAAAPTLEVLTRTTSWMSVLLTVLAAAGLEVGWIELLAGPMGQISPVSLQRLSRETLVNIGPVVISLVYVLRCAPLLTLLSDSRRRSATRTQSLPRGGLLRLCRRELWQGLLGTCTLFVYFLITILLTVILCKAGGQPWLVIHRILSVLQAGDISLGLAKTGLFSAITTLICCLEGFSADADHRSLAWRLSDALLYSTLGTLGTALVLILLIHPPPL